DLGRGTRTLATGDAQNRHFYKFEPQFLSAFVQQVYAVSRSGALRSSSYGNINRALADRDVTESRRVDDISPKISPAPLTRKADELFECTVDHHPTGRIGLRHGDRVTRRRPFFVRFGGREHAV